MSGPVDVLAVMASEWRKPESPPLNADAVRQAIRDGARTDCADELEVVMPFFAELIDCVGDAQSLLAEIDSAVRAEHAKNGHPKSKSVAGIINERLTAALARAQGGAA